MSWTWQPGIGWRKAVGLQGLPYVTGFGHRTSVEPLIDELENHLIQSGVEIVSWEAIVKIIPSFRRLIPADFKLLERALERRGMVILDDKGSLAQVGRRP